jgi:flagellar biosynthesis GTPase FlhF
MMTLILIIFFINSQSILERFSMENTDVDSCISDIKKIKEDLSKYKKKMKSALKLSDDSDTEDENSDDDEEIECTNEYLINLERELDEIKHHLLESKCTSKKTKKKRSKCKKKKISGYNRELYKYRSAVIENGNNYESFMLYNIKKRLKDIKRDVDEHHKKHSKKLRSAKKLQRETAGMDQL